MRKVQNPEASVRKVSLFCDRCGYETPTMTYSSTNNRYEDSGFTEASGAYDKAMPRLGSFDFCKDCSATLRKWFKDGTTAETRRILKERLKIR